MKLIFRIVLLTLFLAGWLTEYCGEVTANDVGQTITDTNLTEKVAADYEKYKKGQIDKGQMMQSVANANNQTPQEMYGKVIDQNGQPVVGVEVKGITERIEDFNERFTTYTTQTDTNGLFQFTGLRGYRLDAEVAKAGYEIIYQGGRVKPLGISTPDNRVIFNMWKLRGPEPMIHVQIQSSVPCDGTPEHYNLLVSKRNHTVPDGQPSSGDFTIKLTRDPLIVDRRKPFNWSVTMSITNGGLQETTNIYSYEAPAEGYQPTITLNFPTNSTGWKNEINNMYYFKSKEGQIYGRIKIHILADRSKPPTYFDAEVYANPAGSRNLEFDPGKQINQ